LWSKTPRRSARLPSGGAVPCAVTACKSDAKRRRPRFGRYTTCGTVDTLTNHFGDRSARFVFFGFGRAARCADESLTAPLTTWRARPVGSSKPTSRGRCLPFRVTGVLARRWNVPHRYIETVWQSAWQGAGSQICGRLWMIGIDEVEEGDIDVDDGRLMISRGAPERGFLSGAKSDSNCWRGWRPACDDTALFDRSSRVAP
jgi:hypothetical protein